MEFEILTIWNERRLGIALPEYYYKRICLGSEESTCENKYVFHLLTVLAQSLSRKGLYFLKLFQTK